MNSNTPTRLTDGVRYLRGGAIQKAAHNFLSAAQDAQDPATLSEALRRQADTRRRCGEWQLGLELAEEAAQVAIHAGLLGHAASARNIAGTIHLQRGNFADAVTLYHSALALDPPSKQAGLICQNLGTTCAMQRDFTSAAEWYQQSSEHFETAGAEREQILALNNAGSALMDQGLHNSAADLFRRAGDRASALVVRDTELEAIANLNLAEALARQNAHLGEAHSLVLRAIGHFSSSGNRPYQTAAYRVLALVSEAEGQADTAEAALSAGLRLAREVGAQTEIEHFEREQKRLRGDLTAAQPATTTV